MPAAAAAEASVPALGPALLCAFGTRTSYEQVTCAWCARRGRVV